MMIRPVYALVSDLFFATKIVKSAQAVGLSARAFDTAERLLEAAKEAVPALVILDCERLEKEAFELLRQFRLEASFSAIPCLGFLSHTAQELKREMRDAGCMQVYSKSEFTKELELILGRYGHGLSSRL